MNAVDILFVVWVVVMLGLITWAIHTWLSIRRKTKGVFAAIRARGRREYVRVGNTFVENAGVRCTLCDHALSLHVPSGAMANLSSQCMVANCNCVCAIDKGKQL